MINKNIDINEYTLAKTHIFSCIRTTEFVQQFKTVVISKVEYACGAIDLYYIIMKNISNRTF